MAEWVRRETFKVLVDEDASLKWDLFDTLKAIAIHADDHNRNLRTIIEFTWCASKDGVWIVYLPGINFEISQI